MTSYVFFNIRFSQTPFSQLKCRVSACSYWYVTHTMCNLADAMRQWCRPWKRSTSNRIASWWCRCEKIKQLLLSMWRNNVLQAQNWRNIVLQAKNWRAAPRQNPVRGTPTWGERVKTWRADQEVKFTITQNTPDLVIKRTTLSSSAPSTTGSFILYFFYHWYPQDY